MTVFQRAERRKQKLRLALEGPSGSGKTYSALQIARGLTDDDLSKVAIIDTEHGSAALYADLGPFATLDLRPPYAPERYIEAIAAAEAEGYELLIIDSLSHAWSKEGGLLDRVDQIAAAKTNGNTFAAWRDGGKIENRLLSAMLESSCHVIATIRTKTEWVVEENERGKKVPRKIGLSPDQRKDIDFEFTLVFDLSREHIATASKDRTGLFDDQFAVPSQQMGITLLEWLESGIEAPRVEYVSAEQVAVLRSMITAMGRQVPRVEKALQVKEICRGGLETIPIEAYEHVTSTLAAMAATSANGDKQSETETPPATADEKPAAKSESSTEEAAEPENAQPEADEKPAAEPKAATEKRKAAEPTDRSVVAVLWPDASEAVSVEIGGLTRYGELIANYLASTGGAEKEPPEQYAVFDDAGNECAGRKVIPSTVWGQTFKVVALEAKQPAAEPAGNNGKGRKGKAKAKPEPSHEETDAELDRAIGPQAEIPEEPDPKAIKRGTLQALGIVCSNLSKAGWSEQSWRGVMSALTGGKRSRKDLTEVEGKNVLRSLKYELEQLKATAAEQKGEAA